MSSASNGGANRDARKPHSRRFDRVEILNRLKAVEAGEMTLYERELVEQYEGAEKELDLTCKLLDERLAEITRLEEQVEALREECADWERGADEELARAWKERALASEEQLEAVVEATRFKAGEDCWCAFRQVDDPDWHSPTCERVREILGASNPAKSRCPATEPCECGRPTSVCQFSCDFCTGGDPMSDTHNTPLCPKCGTDDVLVRWHDRKKRGDYFGPCERERSATSRRPVSDKEHLHYHCRRCQYDWLGPTLAEMAA